MNKLTSNLARSFQPLQRLFFAQEPNRRPHARTLSLSGERPPQRRPHLSPRDLFRLPVALEETSVGRGGTSHGHVGHGEGVERLHDRIGRRRFGGVLPRGRSRRRGERNLEG